MNCACGFPCARRTSWTHENPGRKFIACKFYNHETGQRGCNTFEWLDIAEPTGWQRDVINMLLAEKHRLAADNYILNSRIGCVELERNRLAQDLGNSRRMPMEEVEIRKGGSNVMLYVVVSAFVSFIVARMLG